MEIDAVGLSVNDGPDTVLDQRLLAVKVLKQRNSGHRISLLRCSISRDWEMGKWETGRGP
jgi:hypothetical protein